MKKKFILGTIAVVAALAGVAITLLTLVKRGQNHLKKDEDCDNTKCLDEEFDINDDIMFDEVNPADATASMDDQTISSDDEIKEETDFMEDIDNLEDSDIKK